MLPKYHLAALPLLLLVVVLQQQQQPIAAAPTSHTSSSASRPAGTRIFIAEFNGRSFAPSQFGEGLRRYFGRDAPPTFPVAEQERIGGGSADGAGGGEVVRFQFTIADAQYESGLESAISNDPHVATLIVRLRADVHLDLFSLVYVMLTRAPSGAAGEKTFMEQYGLYLGLGLGSAVVLVIVAVALVSVQRRAAQHERLRDAMEAMNDMEQQPQHEGGGGGGGGSDVVVASHGGQQGDGAKHSVRPAPLPVQRM